MGEARDVRETVDQNARRMCALRYSLENLQSVCKSHHAKLDAAERRA